MLVVLGMFGLLAGGAPSAASAQTDGMFAVGAQLMDKTAVNPSVHGGPEIGIIWRVGHSVTGWGWDSAFNWFSTDVDRPVGGARVALGELDVKPVMVGYGYTHARNRIAITGDVLGGYAFTHFSMASAAVAAFQQRLGAQVIDTDISNTFVLKPEVGVWYDVNQKIGLNISAGYLIARPRLTITSTGAQDSRRVRADMLMLNFGFVYSVF
jgi:hypothetical protein